MKHTKLECTDPECTGDCNTCQLFTCSVCNCSEGELPTDCPGESVPPHVRDLIYSGLVDYKGDQWEDEFKQLNVCQTTGRLTHDN